MLYLQGNFTAFIKEQDELSIQISKLGKEPNKLKKAEEIKSKQ